MDGWSVGCVVKSCDDGDDDERNEEDDYRDKSGDAIWDSEGTY